MKICDKLKKTIQIAMNKLFKKGDVALVNVNAEKLAGRKVTVASSAKAYEGGKYVDVKDSDGKMHKIDVGVLRHASVKTAPKKKAAPAKVANVVSSKPSGAKKPATKKAAPKSATKTSAKSATKAKPGTVCLPLLDEEYQKEANKRLSVLKKKSPKADKGELKRQAYRQVYREMYK